MREKGGHLLPIAEKKGFIVRLDSVSRWKVAA